MTPAEQTRQDFFTALAQFARLRPDWQVGQTLANLAMTAGQMDANGVGDLEDDEALAARVLIEQHMAVAAEASGGNGVGSFSLQGQKMNRHHFFPLEWSLVVPFRSLFAHIVPRRQACGGRGKRRRGRSGGKSAGVGYRLGRRRRTAA